MGAEPDPAAVAVHDGDLRFRVEGPNGSVATDMATAVGGGATAPSPGWMLRAALASCDATLVAMEAAAAGIVLSSLRVTVDSSSDARGLLGTDPDVPAGPLAVRVRIELAADGVAPEELRALVERAEARSPVRDALARAVPMTTEVVV
jgi:uncharacterized OsmC-like protein